MLFVSYISIVLVGFHMIQRLAGAVSWTTIGVMANSWSIIAGSISCGCAGAVQRSRHSVLMTSNHLARNRWDCCKLKFLKQTLYYGACNFLVLVYPLLSCFD